MVALSFASYLSMYPILLLPPLVLLAYDCQVEKRRVASSSKFATTSVAVVAGCMVSLLGMSFLLANNSWEFLARTYGIQLTLSDLTPNVGLWWYFFIEMFDSFRAFFLGVFWLHLASYPAALSIRLRPQPLAVLTILLLVLSPSSSPTLRLRMRVCSFLWFPCFDMSSRSCDTLLSLHRLYCTRRSLGQPFITSGSMQEVAMPTSSMPLLLSGVWVRAYW
ncbi:hypothetical protein NXS19_000842 [Fusarium pseudograminearum]|nr:hypothetical protein NXS19_000842 [Fusarium pseudograminearum]